MSYCVNCGVELAANQHKCPLCGVPVVNPIAPIKEPAAPMFPPDLRYHPIAPGIRRAAILSIAMLLLIPLLSTIVCDIAISGELTWSRFVGIAYLILYTFIFPPLLLNKNHTLISLLLDFAVLLLAQYLICTITGGSWFLPFSLPLTAILWVFILSIYAATRLWPWRYTRHICLSFWAIGLFCLLLELLINNTFLAGKPLNWSLITVIPFAILGVFLLIIDANKELKEYLRRRFFI